MKATGIVRRIDDLGRVVIPKEIRRTMRIREGDPLEIFTDREGEVILKKYSPINELNSIAGEYAQAVYDVLGNMIVITDRDQVISVMGKGKREMEQKRISRELEKVIQGKSKKLVVGREKILDVVAGEKIGGSFESQIIVPIVSQGDPIGGIVLLSENKTDCLGDAELKIAETGAEFLARQMEN